MGVFANSPITSVSQQILHPFNCNLTLFISHLCIHIYIIIIIIFEQTIEAKDSVKMFNAYLTVAILVGINLINYMDRFTIAGVLDEIQNYFEINDATAGLLQTSFIVSYMVFSPLFGYLGDRYSRKYIILFGVSFWSSMTLFSSFVQPHHTYWFFLFRALVGIGEASYATVAPTIIADLFIGSKRSTMLAMFYFAIPVGSGLGYIIGIAMLNIFGHWSYALRFTPALGVLSVIGFLFVNEPARGAIEQAHQVPEDEIEGRVRNISSVLETLRNDFRYLFSIPTYLFTTLGFTCVCFSVGALSWWAPTFMQNADPTSSKGKVGLIFGIIACFGGIIGVLIGYISSWYFRPKYPTADSWVCAVGVFLSIPFGFLAILLSRSSTTISWIFIFLSVTFLSTNWSVVVDILLYVIVPQRRSTAQSIQILTSHILGDASSPFIIGAISDAFSKDGVDKYHSLSYALYLTPAILIFGVVFFALSSRFIIKDEQRCKQMITSCESGASNSDSNLSHNYNSINDGLEDARGITSSNQGRINFGPQSESRNNLINNSNLNNSGSNLHQRT